MFFGLDVGEFESGYEWVTRRAMSFVADGRTSTRFRNESICRVDRKWANGMIALRQDDTCKGTQRRLYSAVRFLIRE